MEPFSWFHGTTISVYLQQYLGLGTEYLQAGCQPPSASVPVSVHVPVPACACEGRARGA